MRCAITRPPGAPSAPAARRYAYFRPTSLEEAFALKRQSPGARFVAGGTDLMVRVAQRVEQPAALVSLRSVAELRTIDVGSRVSIGGAVTIAELIAHPELKESLPVLIAAARCLGSPQIRSVATVAGNLCNASPCADTAPPLLVLDARVAIAGPSGWREEALESFFAGPGRTSLRDDELVAAVMVERPRKGTLAAFTKKRRVRMDLALASVAVQLGLAKGRLRGVRVAAGSVAPTPLRLRSVEALLEGQALSSDLLDAAAQCAADSVAPISDLRASEDYRRHIVGVYLKRALQQLADGEAS